MRRLIASFLAAALISVQPMLAEARSLSTIRDAEIENTLELMAAPIFRAAGFGADTVKMFIISDKSLNAFVVGRNMAFHTGLLIELEEPGELLGVIAHETGHIAGGHGARTRDALGQARAIGIVGTILGVAAAAAGSGRAGAAIAASAQHVAKRDLLRYSRGQESSADQAAIGYLEQTGTDPAGLLRTFERLKQQHLTSTNGRDPYALSHPTSQTRIQNLRHRIERASTRGREVAPDLAYRHARMRAKLRGFIHSPVRVLRDTPDDDSELSLLARSVALHRLPDPLAARRAVERLVALKPNDAYYQELKGQILFESGDGAAALPALRQAVTLAPDEPLILGLLGQALLSLGDPRSDAEALNILQRATRQDRLDARAWLMLARAERRAGNDIDAALAGAEYHMLRSSHVAARRDAEIVKRGVAYGSRQWLRADDILSELDRIEG